MPEIQNTHKEISASTWWLRLGISVFTDTLKLLVAPLDFIPGLGTILNIMIGWFYFGGMYLWFKQTGEKFSRQTMLFGFAFDFVPFIGDFTETATMIRLYIKYKAEAEAAKLAGGLGEGIGAAAQSKMSRENRMGKRGFVTKQNEQQNQQQNAQANQPARQSVRQPTRPTEIDGQEKQAPQRIPGQKSEQESEYGQNQSTTSINKPFRNTQGNIVTGETFQQRRKRMQIENRQSVEENRKDKAA